MDVELLAEPDIRIRASVDGREAVDYRAGNWFTCLRKLRAALEADGYLLCCQGARPDVHPSAEQLQADLGRTAYRLVPGEPRTDVVDVFASAEPAEVGTVEDQRRTVFAYYGI
ncbi:hypothetical protein Actkin_06166 [Actinokineospora sp. UTMC 2448]|nr:hypothetical protein Actkin_06166 [Actinokineospora sp. UTMC 2448]